MARIVWDAGWREKLDKKIHDFIEDLAEDVLNDMIIHCPVDTGALIMDLDKEVHGTDARIGAKSVPHAIWVEEGVSPHLITPNSAGALWWEGARHPVKRVNHPGYPGTHFMKKALYKARF